MIAGLVSASATRVHVLGCSTHFSSGACAPTCWCERGVAVLLPTARCMTSSGLIASIGVDSRRGSIAAAIRGQPLASMLPH